MQKEEGQVKKYYNESGEVAILYSPGYGAGWSSWASKHQEAYLIFDKSLVEAVLAGDREKAARLAKEHFAGESFYTGGAKSLEVRWLKPGTLFRIDEYDGAESVEVFSEDSYRRA
jgi:hypothetical protein